MSLYLKKRKRFLKKLLVGISLFSIGAAVFYLYSWFLKPRLPDAWTRSPIEPVVLMTLVFLAAYKPLDILATQLFKKYVFTKRNYRHITLMNLAEDLTLILDLPELANLVVNTFGEVFHLKSVALLVTSPLRNDFEIASGFGWNISDVRRVRFSQEAPLVNYMRSNGPHVMVRDRVVRVLPWQEANRLSNDFDRLHANWIIPLFLEEEFVGAIAFSSAHAETVFDEAEFHLFREFAARVAKSVRNALCVQELKMANEKLQDMQSQLLQSTKLTAIEQLATGLAHEIHNPLTIISGKAQVLLLQKDRNMLDERVEEVLKTIVKQTKRAADITRKLLMFSQGSQSPREALSLEQVLNDTLALVSYQTSLEGIEIARSVGSGIPAFYGNVHELREVFMNLVLNAIQSVGSQGKIRIEIIYDPVEQLYEIHVADTGKGIGPEHLDKLFNPFFTTRDEAVGLGLFVTKQIVHRYGGSIRVESHPGQGTLFLVRFPYVEPPASVKAEKAPSFSLFPNT